jgi:hypothetical protein
MRPSRWLLAAVMIAAFSPAAFAASLTEWDGTWGGSWGGSRPTSITIANKKVVSFEYQGVSTPVATSTVTSTSVTYGHNGTTVILTKTGETTAHAKLHSDQGDATAELTRQ